ncbi:hypothetical protein BDZ97DRAFT_1672757, partial [Flammula alnicola]
MLDEVRVLSWNVARDGMSLDVILSTCTNIYDIIFVQEPPWRHIRTAPSAKTRKGEDVIGAPNHPDWLAMVRAPTTADERPRVMTYVSTRLARYRPSVRRDVIDHPDIQVLSLSTSAETFFLMNVYSDADHGAINWLKAHDTALPRFHFMGGDFNAHAEDWDPGHSGREGCALSLQQSAAILGLELAAFGNPGPTHIPRDPTKRKTVIDLAFVPPNQVVRFSPEGRGSPILHHAPIPISITLDISPAPLGAVRMSLPTDDVPAFINSISSGLRAIDPTAPLNTEEQIEAAAQAVALVFSSAWDSHAKESFVTRRSKPWWTQECSDALGTFRRSRLPEDWKSFRKVIRDVKREFFDQRIHEIASANKRPWDLMNWVQQRKLPPCEALHYRGEPCNDMPALWDALHGTYNSASDRV